MSITRRRWPRAVALALPLILAVPLAMAGGTPDAASGAILVRVVDGSGHPVAGASVDVAELRRTLRTGDDGRVRFDDVPAGRYHLEAKSRALGVAVADVLVRGGEAAGATLVLGLAIHTEEIVVSARPGALRRDESFQPVDVADALDLAAEGGATLGETLEDRLGVSSTAFGQGASRPVIRGLGADRTRVLENGLGTGDVSSISPDHAVSIDPGNAARIEIVRGPATLMYGGGAVGGVVNVLDERIPDRMPERPVSGHLLLRRGSNARARSGAVSLTGAAGGLAWHAGGSVQRQEDVEIPATTSGSTRLANSAVATDSWDVGASRVFGSGFVGASFSRYASLHGVPGPGAEGPVRIDVERTRWSLRGQFDLAGSWLRSAKLSAARTRYAHRELEGGAVGTRFASDAWETRVELLHRPLGGWSGSLGLQLGRTDLEAEGEEAFLAPSSTGTVALFVFEELHRDSWRWLAGARWERQAVATSFRGRDVSRDVSAVSVSLGARRTLPGGWTAVATVSRAARMPSVEELASFGEHAATGSFEIGDPRLAPEITLALDLSLRRRSGAVTGELDLFWNRIDRFILERPATAPAGTATDLPVFAFTAEDARFLGGETRLEWRLLDRPERQLALELASDYVRAERRRDGMPLPFIPPWRTRIGLHVHGPKLFGRFELTRVSEQSRVFCEADAPPEACETPTAGWTMLDFRLGLRMIRRGAVHELILRADNLGNRLARNHVSRLKALAPLPARNFSLTWRVDL